VRFVAQAACMRFHNLNLIAAHTAAQIAIIPAEITLLHTGSLQRHFNVSISPLFPIPYERPIVYLKPTPAHIFMPSIAKEQKQYYKSRIRSVIAQHPQITQVALRERLKDDGLILDRWYVASLLKEIQVERVKRLNTLTLNYAISAFQDVMMEISAVAWSIANDEFARKQDRVAALREIREAHKDMFEKLFDAGVFERKLGTLDAVIRNTPLPEERKQAIRSVFQNWGLLQAPKEDEQTTAPAS
jgi:hypothetical protein